MNSLGLGSEGYPRPVIRPDNCDLRIIQEPERAKVVTKGKEKDRKPIDPPPIIQLFVNDSYNSICSFVHSPYLFCSCTLWEESRDEPKLRSGIDKGSPLTGTVTSSLHRLKDLRNTEGGFFVFGDVSANIAGKARLHFQLYELRPQERDVVPLKSATTHVFDVATAKDWDGVKESTMLSRSFADQGVRLRLRKESRNAARNYHLMAAGASTSAGQTPIRPYPASSAAYGASLSSPEAEHPSKKHKSLSSSMDSSAPYPTPTSMTSAYTPSKEGHSGAQMQTSSAYASTPLPAGSYGHSYAAYGTSGSPYQGYGGQSSYGSYGNSSIAQPYQPAPTPPYQFTAQSYSSNPSQQYYTQGHYPQQSYYRSSSSGYYGGQGGQQRPTGAMANPQTTPTLPPMRTQQRDYPGQPGIMPSIEEAQQQQEQGGRGESHHLG